MGKWRSAEQLVAEAKMKLARAEARADKNRRAMDTRRKVLLGAWALQEIETNARFRQWAEKGLDGFLTRDADREVLDDLLPHGKPEDAPTPSTPQPARSADRRRFDDRN